MNKPETIQSPILQGTVLHTDGHTARVQVVATKMHPIYKKRFTVQKNVAAHIPAGTTVVIGQRVTVVPARRVSKTKGWQIKYAS